MSIRAKQGRTWASGPLDYFHRRRKSRPTAVFHHVQAGTCTVRACTTRYSEPARSRPMKVVCRCFLIGWLDCQPRSGSSVITEGKARHARVERCVRMCTYVRTGTASVLPPPPRTDGVGNRDPERNFQRAPPGRLAGQAALRRGWAGITAHRPSERLGPFLSLERTTSAAVRRAECTVDGT